MKSLGAVGQWWNELRKVTSRGEKRREKFPDESSVGKPRSGAEGFSGAYITASGIRKLWI